MSGRHRFPVFPVFFIIAGLLLYGFLLTNRSIPALRTLGVFTRYNFTILVPILVIIFTLAFTPSTRLGKSGAFLLSIALFGLSLTGLWASGQSEASIASGLLPQSDASNYYHDALRMLEGFDFSAFTAWRPIFASMLSGILAITRQNLQAALAVLVFMAGLSAFLLAFQVRQSHGTLPAAALFTLLFLYYRRFSGTTLTENIGFTLGCLGLALIWQDKNPKKWWMTAAGLFAISLGLNARPGPFLILPFIMIWGLYRYRQSGIIAKYFCLTGLAVILAGFLSNLVVQRQVIHEPIVPFSNFNNIIYGIVSGGQGWTQLAADHPEIGSLKDPQKTLVSLQIIFDEFSQHPENTLTGIAKNYSAFFSKSYYNVFSFVRGENPTIAEISRWLLYALAAFGLLYGLIRREDDLAFLEALSAVGILLSVLFISPGDAFGMRMYAAGIPEIVLLPVLGLYALIKRFKLLAVIVTPANNFQYKISLGFLIAITAAIIFSPAVIRITRPTVIAQTHICPDGQIPVAYRLTSGSFIRIVREDTWQLDWMPEFHHGRFSLQIHNLPDPAQIEEFDRIEGEVTLVSGIDILSGAKILAVAPTEILPEPPALIRACGEWSPNPEARPFDFFYIRSIVK